MSKFAIVLCAVLVASAANAAEWSDSISSVQTAIQEVIDGTILEVQKKVQPIQERNQEIGKSLSDTATKFSQRISNEVHSITQRIGAQTNKLAEEVQGVDISDCIQYPNHLNATAKDVLIKTGECVAEKLRTGLDQIVGIDELVQNEFARLNGIREEAGHCDDNVRNQKSAVDAVLCIRAAGLKAASIPPAFDEELTVRKNTLNFVFERFESYVADCETTNGLPAFHRESSTVVEKTDKCIQQKSN